jgi:hypothetical protein
VNAHRTVDVVIALRQRLDGSGVIGAYADTQKVTDAPATRRIESGVQRTPVLSEVETIEMTVGIYKHGY